MQGFELHYAVNFLGHFALTQHLLPTLLEQRARVVVVSSILHTYATAATFALLLFLTLFYFFATVVCSPAGL
jgi:NAD(P)-dependent dehydrogenase (short-subunit alcohol dehydrogenase family)